MDHSSIELPHPLQVAAYQRMTPGERLAAGFEATEFVRDRLRARFMELYPHWSTRQIESAVARRLVGFAE